MEWKNKINENKVYNILNRFNVNCNHYVQLILKDKKGRRRFYDILIKANNANFRNKWLLEVGQITEEEWENYNLAIHTLKEVKLKDFQYKLNNKILVTKSFLHKINRVENNLCSYCHQHVETIYHLFIECEKVRQFWGIVKQWLSTNFNININLDAKELLFSGQNKNVLLSYISVVSKHYIYTNKFTERELNISNYISLLKKKFQSERYIAYVHTSKFFIKWLPLYNYFTTYDNS